MYRDSAHELDEHDRAVGAILVGEALVDTCEAAVVRSRAVDTTSADERWRAIADVHDAYPEIWRHLDRARRELAGRGDNTAAYDELRPHAPRSAASDREREEIDVAALDDARRAIAELKLAVPGADWEAIEARTQGLVRAPLSRARRQRLGFAAAATVFALAAVAWLAALVPEHKRDPREAMRDELAQIAQQRKDTIAVLAQSLGDACKPGDARELVKLLVLDGRTDDARAFAAGYVDRCGEDPVVQHWGHAPRPHH